MSLTLQPFLVTLTYHPPITNKNPFLSIPRSSLLPDHSSFSPLHNNAVKKPTNNGTKSLIQASSTKLSSITLEKDASQGTIFVIRTQDKTGFLDVITRVLKGFKVENFNVQFEERDDCYVIKFVVTDLGGKKIEDEEKLLKIESALKEGFNEGVVVRKAGYVGGKSNINSNSNSDRMFELMDGFLKNDPVSLQKDILHHVEYTVARSRFSFDDFEAYQALSHSVRDRLIERWHDTQQHFKKKDPKRLYFLSLEFLMGKVNAWVRFGRRPNGSKGQHPCRGRSLSNSVINLGIRDQCAEALSQLGFEYEVLAEQEGDAALGNGGLARLSACQMDSLATLDYPAWGYGLRYQYGLFRQIIMDGFQYEQPDYWLNFGNPWEIERVHVSYPVKFYGNVTEEVVNGKKCKVWIPGETVEAVAYDNPIPGYGTRNTINLRLWAAKPSDGYDIESYNTGDYINAIVNRQKAEIISNVLYPDDRSYQGKELRLKQQYFFVSASLQDIIRRFKDVHGNFDEFPDKVALQLNDTHPSISIAELMRVLLDEEHLGWKKSWNIIIYDINFAFMEELKKKIGQDYSRLSRMSIVEEGAVKNIRVANLSIVCSHTVNGVSRAHYELLKTRVFKDFYELWPEKFQYKTNGVTQVKKINKMRLAEYIETMSGVKVSLDAMFDVQIKRIHEYKRQLLNILGVIHRYDCIKNMEKDERKKVVPRVCIIGGKAPPGYEIAKKIIKLCHAVAETINNDDDVGDLLKLVFIPDYNVSVAELVIPGSDLSQHISTAGHEASGTGSMKFLMNGCLLLATADGSTNEIIEEIGSENMFIFGAKISEVPALREKDSTIKAPLQFVRVVRMVRDGYFGFKDYFKSLCDTVENGKDFYLLGSDFASYLEAQAAADRAYVDKKKWSEMSILCTAGSARFSSDRTIEDYAETTWGIQPCKCPF
ncbi:hypothetical protein M8C21_025042 [Ambrosia artemisiifolia]|uniref:Alpha-1,4 glucan phosphorylase n=1 Tax=Ambrosia artemisiifolia TaxID=4212 RepID=A0AAD5DBV8_AMBAR|nr:hypothetical protein M8C21_025042 [Ambrosia artemisiifolia]